MKGPKQTDKVFIFTCHCCSVPPEIVLNLHLLCLIRKFRSIACPGVKGAAIWKVLTLILLPSYSCIVPERPRVDLTLNQLNSNWWGLINDIYRYAHITLCRWLFQRIVTTQYKPVAEVWRVKNEHQHCHQACFFFTFTSPLYFIMIFKKTFTERPLYIIIELILNIFGV